MPIGAQIIQQPPSPLHYLLSGMGGGMMSGFERAIEQRRRGQELAAQVLMSMDPALLATDFGQLIPEAMGIGEMPAIKKARDIGQRQFSEMRMPPQEVGAGAEVPLPSQPTPPVQVPGAGVSMPSYREGASVPYEAYTQYQKALDQEKKLQDIRNELFTYEAKADVDLAKELEEKQISADIELRRQLDILSSYKEMMKRAGVNDAELDFKVGSMSVKIISNHQKSMERLRLAAEKGFNPGDHEKAYYDWQKETANFNVRMLQEMDKIVNGTEIDPLVAFLAASRQLDLISGAANMTKDDRIDAVFKGYATMRDDLNKRGERHWKKSGIEDEFTEIPNIGIEAYKSGKKKKDFGGSFASELDRIRGGSPPEPATQTDTRNLVVASPEGEVDAYRVKRAKNLFESDLKKRNIDLLDNEHWNSLVTFSNIMFANKEKIMADYGLNKAEFARFVEDYKKKFR